MPTIDIDIFLQKDPFSSLYIDLFHVVSPIQFTYVWCQIKQESIPVGVYRPLNNCSAS